ncbi:hypothetical protein EW146_g5996 [Bondarzewia mesenterica]|uniref:Uncharacterized protein n=1 Tax=Bondarzewia mesenterica TaxID=1095465 RepID=A0A4S4LRP1_9AGAM|nr:hypothetical protein EW146_g5996 [Bondarzewia mesenterica]
MSIRTRYTFLQYPSALWIVRTALSSVCAPAHTLVTRDGCGSGAMGWYGSKCVGDSVPDPPTVRSKNDIDANEAVGKVAAHDPNKSSSFVDIQGRASNHPDNTGSKTSTHKKKRDGHCTVEELQLQIDDIESRPARGSSVALTHFGAWIDGTLAGMYPAMERLIESAVNKAMDQAQGDKSQEDDPS